jgi:hypothetical protein
MAKPQPTSRKNRVQLSDRLIIDHRGRLDAEELLNKRDRLDHEAQGLISKWIAPFAQAVVDTEKYLLRDDDELIDEDNDVWEHLGYALKDHPAWKIITEHCILSPGHPRDEGDMVLTAGFMFVAGIMYASTTGVKIQPPKAKKA